jgi:hypothetical protein
MEEVFGALVIDLVLRESLVDRHSRQPQGRQPLRAGGR